LQIKNVLFVGDREIKPKVAELSTDEENSVQDQNDEDDDNENEEEDFDWYIQQVEPDSETDLALVGDQEYGYGFGFAQQGVFSRLVDELGQLLDIADPDGQTHRMRREAAEAKEREKFDGDHYLCDLYETEEIEKLLRYRYLIAVLRIRIRKDPELFAGSGSVTRGFGSGSRSRSETE
jgi:hypothetical protein